MTPVTRLSDMPRYRFRKAAATPPRGEESAQIHILPCIRREPLAASEAMRQQAPMADAHRSA